MNNSVKKIALISILITLSIVLSYVDSLIILPFAIPGIKLGIANIATVYTLFRIGIKESIIVSIFRIILSSILFGTILSFSYSLAGAALSLALMIILKRFIKISLITISILGAIMHNVGQILMAMILLETKEIILYLPVLVITGTIAGIGVGLLSILTLKYTKNIKLNINN